MKRLSTSSQRLSGSERDNAMDKYSTLRAREEDLNARIGEVEKECNTLTEQIAEVQADLNAIEDRKWDLEEEKEHVMVEKQKLRDMLDNDELLEFGFEAGRRMENKKLRMS
jgi:septal ring factor EnvC (AmiA/AmiB activator)